jgi:hypothetical protein
VPIDFTRYSSCIALDNSSSYHLQLIMVETTAVIAAFAIGWLCRSILLRLGKPVQRQRPRGPADNRPVQLRRPASTPINPWVGPARAAATNETGEVQRLRAKLAAASEVCEQAGRRQQLESRLAELDGGKA